MKAIDKRLLLRREWNRSYHSSHYYLSILIMMAMGKKSSLGEVSKIFLLSPRGAILVRTIPLELDPTEYNNIVIMNLHQKIDEGYHQMQWSG